MSVWWTALVLALHLVPSVSAEDPFFARIFISNQLIAEIQVQERVSGVFSLSSSDNPRPARIERSDLYGQVYTVFSPWDLVAPSTETEESEETEDTVDPNYAAGTLPPLAIDLTPLLSQSSLRIPGRYTLTWQLPPVAETEGEAPTEDSTAGTEINLILEENIMTLFSPSLGLMIQLNGI